MHSRNSTSVKTSGRCITQLAKMSIGPTIIELKAFFFNTRTFMGTIISINNRDNTHATNSPNSTSSTINNSTVEVQPIVS